MTKRTKPAEPAEETDLADAMEISSEKDALCKEAAEPEQAQAQATENAPEPENQLFTVGAWHALPQWRCNLCPWDTLDGEAAMLAHLAERHAPKLARTSILGIPLPKED